MKTKKESISRKKPERRIVLGVDVTENPKDIRHPKKKFTFEEFFRKCDEIAKMNVFDDSVL